MSVGERILHAARARAATVAQCDDRPAVRQLAGELLSHIDETIRTTAAVRLFLGAPLGSSAGGCDTGNPPLTADGATMKYVSTDGRVIREMTFGCPKCKNDVPCSLTLVEGGHPLPYDVPLYCAGCLCFVALLNPSQVADAPKPGVPERDFMAETELLEDELTQAEHSQQ